VFQTSNQISGVSPGRTERCVIQLQVALTIRNCDNFDSVAKNAVSTLVSVETRWPSLGRPRRSAERKGYSTALSFRRCQGCVRYLPCSEETGFPARCELVLVVSWSQFGRRLGRTLIPPLCSAAAAMSCRATAILIGSAHRHRRPSCGWLHGQVRCRPRQARDRRWPCQMIGCA
jgi:hypothetical protein